MVTKREQNRITIRNRILAAARELVVETASTDFSMPQLAKTAGVALVTPYKHFESKAGVLHALLNEQVDNSTWRTSIESKPPLNPIDRILEFGNYNIMKMVASDKLSRPIVAGLIRLNGQHAFALGEQWVPQWQIEIEAAFDAGLVYSFINPQLVARSLHLAFSGAFIKWLIYETNSEQLAADVRYSTAIILLGVATESGEPLLRHRFSEAEQSLAVALENTSENEACKHAVES